jgi:serine/threonine protein kinase
MDSPPTFDIDLRRKMSVTIGSQLGSYEITALLGKGGFGEVYRAKDKKLKREVAIKILPDEFSSDHDRLTRFQREAEVLASLNHPNIAAIYDLAAQGQSQFLVLELVDGETLADRIARGPIPVEEALNIARQIAEALEAAHEKGVIHRDLKPGNVKIRPDGTVKVLDFGLAMTESRVTATAPDESPTFVASVTQSGVIIGTAAYMSPEQAAGKPLDKRSDVWSFGVVLWELLIGKKLFDGESVAHTLADVLRAEIDFSKLPEQTPVIIRDLLARCLDRDPRSRLRDIGEARVLIQKYLSSKASVSESETEKIPDAPVPTIRRGRKMGLAAVAGIVITLSVAVALTLYSTRTRPVPGPEHWRQITDFPDSATGPAVSPDGRMLAFTRGTGNWMLDNDKQVYVKVLPDGPSVQLTHDPLGKMSPAFSPDGSRIAYTVGGFNTWMVSVIAGGEPQLMLPNAEGLNWIDPQHVLFSENTPRGMGVVTAMENRTSQREIYMPKPIGMAHFSSLSPKGNQLLVVEMSGRTRPEGPFLPCRLLPFDGSSPGRQVGPVPAFCTAAAWTLDGKWMYFTADKGNGSHIWRQRVSGGDPEQVTFGPNEQNGIAMAPDGRSLYTSVGTLRRVLWLHDENGEHQISGEGFPGKPMFSTDGTRVFYPLFTSGASFLVWATDLKTGQAKPLFPGVPMTRWDISADGKSIIYRTPDNSMWMAALDRSSSPVRLPAQNGLFQVGVSGNVYFVTLEGDNSYLEAMRLDGTGRHKVFSDSVKSPQVSADERWVAFLADGQQKVRSIDGGESRIVCGAQNAQDNSNKAAACLFGWSHDGKAALFTFRALTGASGATVAVPLPPGVQLPPLPEGGVRNMEAVVKLPGAVVIPSDIVDVGPGMSYAYSRLSTQQNIFQIPLY